MVAWIRIVASKRSRRVDLKMCVFESTKALIEAG